MSESPAGYDLPDMPDLDSQFGWALADRDALWSRIVAHTASGPGIVNPQALLELLYNEWWDAAKAYRRVQRDLYAATLKLEHIGDVLEKALAGSV